MSSCNDGSIAFAISMGFLSLILTLILISNPIVEEDKIDTSQTLNYVISQFQIVYDGYWYFIIPFGIIIIILPFKYAIYDFVTRLMELRKTPQRSFQKVDEK